MNKNIKEYIETLKRELELEEDFNIIIEKELKIEKLTIYLDEKEIEK